MSTNRPGASRRRRIAGERRPARPVEERAPLAEPAARPEPAPTGAEASPGRRAGATASQTLAPPQPPPAVALDRPAAAGRSGRWGSRSTVASLGAALAVLVTLGVLAALGLLGNDGVRDLDRADAAAQAAETAPASAERAAEAILAYDHQTLDADQDAATRFMTDDFAAEYSETFEKVVKPTAEESRATVTAAVKASATVRASADRARVLLFVDQTTVSRANEQPQVALNRVEMLMVRDGDGWLVDDISSY